MATRVLPKVEDEIKRYQGEHHGERPLYIVLPAEEAERLEAEVRTASGYPQGTIVTEYKGSKIVRHPAMTAGQMQLTNELPEIGS